MVLETETRILSVAANSGSNILLSMSDRTRRILFIGFPTLTDFLHRVFVHFRICSTWWHGLASTGSGVSSLPYIFPASQDLEQWVVQWVVLVLPSASQKARRVCVCLGEGVGFRVRA
jgi:hypothetical protein